MAKDKRVEVLFDPEDYKRLEYKAQSERRSVGSVIRDAVASYVAGPTAADRKAAIDRLLSPKPGEQPLPDWSELKGELARSQYRAIVKGVDYLREEFDREEKSRQKAKRRKVAK